MEQDPCLERFLERLRVSQICLTWLRALTDDLHRNTLCQSGHSRSIEDHLTTRAAAHTHTSSEHFVCSLRRSREGQQLAPCGAELLYSQCFHGFPMSRGVHQTHLQKVCRLVPWKRCAWSGCPRCAVERPTITSDSSSHR